MSTIHIEAEKDEIAPIVLMPGDPKRCKYIADKFLSDAILVNQRREEHAYTGYYKGKKVTIFSSGMGIPSMGIYSYELFNNYNVEAIIRIGTAGSYSEDLKIRDLFLATSSYSESEYDKKVLDLSIDNIMSSTKLNNLIKEKAQELNIELKEGRTHTSEAFYEKMNNYIDIKNEYNCKIVEMECFSLFINAYEAKKKASALLTVTDSFVTNEKMDPSDREKSLDQMIFLALESIISL